MTTSFSLFFSIHVCFYCIVSVFQMIVILKNEAVSFSDGIAWQIKIL